MFEIDFLLQSWAGTRIGVTPANPKRKLLESSENGKETMRFVIVMLKVVEDLFSFEIAFLEMEVTSFGWLVN